MQKKIQTKIIVLIVLLAIAAGVGFLIRRANQPAPLDSFAQCLKDKGTIFYGAFWCPHCQSQKALFGRSAKRLPYVECSTPDSRGQTPICQEKQISGYPTWEFADGSRESGSLPLERLAEKTGCEIPK